MADYERPAVAPATMGRLRERKRDGETWSACLERLMEEAGRDVRGYTAIDRLDGGALREALGAAGVAGSGLTYDDAVAAAEEGARRALGAER